MLRGHSARGLAARWRLPSLAGGCERELTTGKLGVRSARLLTLGPLTLARVWPLRLTSLSHTHTRTYSSMMLFCILMLLKPPCLYLETRKVRERKVMWINCSRMQLKIALNRWISVTAAFAIQNIISFPFSSRPPSQ